MGPTVGRLLLLEAGDRFVFRSDVFLVVDREVIDRENENEIVICLDQATVQIVQSKRDISTSASIHRNGTTTPIFDDDLMLLR